MPVLPLSSLDQTTLTPIVRDTLDSSRAEVTTWQITPITQGKASPAGVCRIAGTAQDNGNIRTWSLIVKDLKSSAQSINADYNTSTDPTADLYWRRELLLYQSGLFDTLPEGLVAPRCYHIDEEPDEGRIWMEDVREDLGAI
jgi:hypothetical protein